MRFVSSVGLLCCYSLLVRGEWNYARIRPELKCSKLKFDKSITDLNDVLEYRESLIELMRSDGICDNTSNSSISNEQLFELNKLLQDNMICSTKNSEKNITRFMEDYTLASVMTICDVDRSQWGLDVGYSRLFDFLFEKKNKLRGALCKKLANEHARMIGGCNLAVRFNTTWGNRCTNADNVYGFSWYFLRVVQMEADLRNSSLYLFGDDYVNESMIEDSNLQRWFESVEYRMNDRTFEDPRNEIFETYVDGISLIREAMKTPLMLNNFGLSIRQISRFFQHHCSNKSVQIVYPTEELDIYNPRRRTKYLVVECLHNSSNRENDTFIRYYDFEPLISMQNFHNFLHVLLLLFSYASNIYAKAVLFAARKTMDSTTFLLIKTLFNTNMIIITTNLFSMIREHIPIEDPFDAIEQFPSSFFNPDFQQNITFLVARASLSSTYTSSGVSDRSNLTVHISNGMSIVNNGIQSLAQAIGAIVLLVIMCIVLYELRISLCGRISSKHFHWCRYLLYVVCVFIAGVHVAISIGQFFALDRLNVLNQGGKHSWNLSEYRDVFANPFFTHSFSRKAAYRCQEAKKVEDEVNLKIYMVFLIGFNVAAVIVILVIITYHQLIIRRISSQIPRSISRDMSQAIRSILLATFVYIIANGGLTYIASYLLISECINEECISKMTLAYHWTRLLCLMDPIIHPIIIIRRLRGMLAIHQDWKRYCILDICKKCVYYTGKPFLNVLKCFKLPCCTRNGGVERGVDDAQKKKQYSLDIDLQTLLTILEREKRGCSIANDSAGT